MKLNRSITENISANLFIQLITYVFSFLTVLFAARVLLPEAYGKTAFISSFTGYFVMIANLGMPIYAMRLCAEKKNNRNELSRVTNELWSIGAVLSIFSLVMLLMVVFVVPRLWENRLLFLIYGSGILFQAFGFEWLFKGLEKFKFLALCQLISKAVSFLFMVLLVHSEKQLPLYAALSVITAYGSNAVCFFVAGKHVDLSFRIRINRSHIKPLFVFFLMSCAVSIYSSLDLTMLGFMKTNTETGLYSVAAKGKAVLTLFGGIVWTSILPQATRLWKDGKKERFESLAGKSLTCVFFIQLFITVICMVFAKEIIFFIGGESYAGAQRAFRILLLSIVPIGISNILGGQVLIPAGKEKLLLNAEIAGAIINFFANLFIIPAYSIEGAAATTVVSEVVVTIICMYYTRTKLQMDFGLGLIRKVIKEINRELKKTYARLLNQIMKDRLPYYCPCCGTWLKGFVEGGYKTRPDCYNPSRYEHIRQDVLCPVCGALPRHRILALWCDSHREELQKAKVLYFAPEIGMSLWMKRNGVTCTTADLEADADLKIDIQETGLPDQSFDIIFCNHVLEHVDDFRAALKEMHRIMTPKGSFICSFPMDPKVSLLDEDPSIQTDEKRVDRYGQFDHKRVFGMEADQLLIDAGFSVEKITGDACPERILPVVGPADYDINILFCCTIPTA